MTYRLIMITHNSDWQTSQHLIRDETALAKELIRRLSPQVETVVHVRGEDGRWTGSWTVGGIEYERMYDHTFIIQNVETERFKVVDLQDGPSTSVSLKDSPLFAGARIGNYLPHRIPELFGGKAPLVEPGWFLAGYPEEIMAFRHQVERIRATQRLSDRLYFSGTVALERTQLRLPCVILRETYPAETAIHLCRFSLSTWYELAAHHRVVMSLGVRGTYCWREFDCFALGIPVLAMPFVAELRHPLMPDAHYVAVDTAYPDLDEVGGFDDPAFVAQKFIERFREVVHAEGYLAEVAANAREWYDAHAAIPKIADEVIEWIADL